MDTVYEINGVYINSKKVEAINKRIFEIIKKELPEEAQTYAVVSYLLDEVLSDLKTKIIEL